MDENKPHQRWLSFGIRDLLWAMVVVGLLVEVVRLRRENTFLAEFTEKQIAAEAYKYMREYRPQTP